MRFRAASAARGAAVSCQRHSDARPKRAIADRLRQIPFAQTGHFIDEAVETALRMARRHFIERGETGRGRSIARRQIRGPLARQAQSGAAY